MSDALCGNDTDKGWAEKFTGRKHTQIPFLNHTQVRSSTNSAGQMEFFTAAQSQEEGFVRKSPPGPPKNPQTPKRKFSGVQWSFSAKRRPTPVPQTPPIPRVEVEVSPVVTPSRSEPQTGWDINPPSLSALRSKLSGVSVSSIPATLEPSEPSLPPVEAEPIVTDSTTQAEGEEGEETVTMENYGSDLFDF